MFLVGLTGGIATGKSTVAAVFREHNVPVIDADELARQVVEPGKPAWKSLRETFGLEYFDETTGALKREKLGQLVFVDEAARKKLNSITHPAIRGETLKTILTLFLKGHRFVVLDTPLLFEVGMDKMVQKTIVVHCPPDTQLSRLMIRNDMIETDATNRITSQMPLEQKCARATFVIDNSGSMIATREQAEKTFQILNGSWLPFAIRTVLAAVLFISAFSIGAVIHYFMS
uniref:Dephospho-CoA kinase domain-containing protein n=1 Tax=Plectus sambesii TaxID=2011161 RepID=A0A914X5V7_9BILA